MFHRFGRYNLVHFNLHTSLETFRRISKALPKSRVVDKPASKTSFPRRSYLVDPTDFGRGGNEGLSVTLCERALLARCWKYSSLGNCDFNKLFSSGFGVVGLVGKGFESAFDKVSMKL